MASPVTSHTPCNPLHVAHYDCTAHLTPEGGWQITANEPLEDYPERYTSKLAHWASLRPQHIFLAARHQDGSWQTLSYAQAYQQVQQLAGALLQRGLNAERPLVILSENSLEHALLALAAQHVGIPYAPISPAYSLLSKSGERVRHALHLLTPGLVYAQNAQRYAQALSWVPVDVELVSAHGTLKDRAVTPFDELLTQAVDASTIHQAHLRVGPDTIAKFLFTSGSTKLPKAVINTHRMLTSSQQMYLQCYPFLKEEPPTLLDWLPWHHTAGGNHNFGMVLYNGGTLYIDAGKPTPEHLNQTVANLKDIAPTIYYTVPKGLEALIKAMKTDAALCTHFFSRIRNIFPVGAAISAPLKQAVDELAIATTGQRIPMTASLGMTETAPFALSAHFLDWEPGNIGIPAPGLEVRLTPVSDKLEVRYRGPNITPGYWRQAELSQEAFDEDGFFRSGDGAVFLNPSNPGHGLRFDGRIAEDFKLDTGTWVNVGDMRMRVMTAGAPYVHDAVITGQNLSELGMLIFLHPAAQTAMTDLKVWTSALLQTLAAQATGSAQLITRAQVQHKPASLDLGEITDKGSINQRRVLEVRRKNVADLYSSSPPDDIILLVR